MCCCVVVCVLTEFIEGVSQFSVKGDKLSKLRCKYSTYCTYVHVYVYVSHRVVLAC